MKNRKYALRNVTPREMDCAPMPTCPEIYEARNVTPQESLCVVGACSEIHQTSESYLIIGKSIGSKEIDLAEKVVEGQVAIEVPKGLIDNRRS